MLLLLHLISHVKSMRYTRQNYLSDVFITNNIFKRADGDVAKAFNYHWIWIEKFDKTFRKLEEEKIAVPKDSKLQLGD